MSNQAGGDAETSARDRSNRDRGVTFVEILITIVLMGTVVLGILAAVRTTVIASARSREAAQIETTLVNAADRINRAPVSCDYTVHVAKAVEAQGWDGAAVRVLHEYFAPNSPAAKPDGFVENPAATPNPGCPLGSASVPQFVDPAQPSLQFVQRVTARITSPSGQLTRDIQVVKSNV